tara:strand:- start:7436 stop:8554 length:1119 start_codon:yes stop_codon:yes gene_type:complete
MEAKDNLKFDNISFDDMVDQGIEAPDAEVVETVEPAEEQVVEISDELDADVKEKEETEVEVEKVIAKKPVKEVKEVVEEEFTEDNENITEEPSVISEVLTQLGYNGEVEYEDSSDGLVQMTKDVAAKLAEEQLEEILDKFPTIKDHMEYVIAGGKSQDFMSSRDPRQDFAAMDLKEDDEATQRVLLGNYFKKKGHDDEFITDLINDYDESGKMYSKAKLAKESLSKIQEVERRELMENQKQVAQQKNQQNEKFWNDVNETVTSNKEFAGITIPEKQKNKFFKYLSQPINKDGMTQSMKDHQEAPLETRLAIDWLMYNDFKLEEIINTKVKTSKAKSLKERIKSQQVKSKSAVKAQRNKTDFNVDDLDLSFGM